MNTQNENTNPAAPFLALGLTAEGGFIKTGEFCLWTPDGQWGVAWDEDGGYSLLDCEGYPANENTMDVSLALYAFERRENWDYVIGAHS